MSNITLKQMEHLRTPSPAPPHRQRSKSINPTSDAATYPIIKPAHIKEYDIPESKYPQCGKLPLRMVMTAPSGGGKGILLQNIILDIYRDCFERIFIWSPSINVDDNWKPVKKYIDDESNNGKMSNKTGDKLYFDEYNHDELEKVIDTQK